MGYSIRIINGATMECVGTIDEEHNRPNITKLIKSYIPARGAVVSEDWSSDCITIVKYEDGTTLGFSI